VPLVRSGWAESEADFVFPEMSFYRSLSGLHQFSHGNEKCCPAPDVHCTHGGDVTAVFAEESTSFGLFVVTLHKIDASAVCEARRIAVEIARALAHALPRYADIGAVRKLVERANRNVDEKTKQYTYDSCVNDDELGCEVNSSSPLHAFKAFTAFAIKNSTSSLFAPISRAAFVIRVSKTSERLQLVASRAKKGFVQQNTDAFYESAVASAESGCLEPLERRASNEWSAVAEIVRTVVSEAFSDGAVVHFADSEQMAVAVFPLNGAHAMVAFLMDVSAATIDGECACNDKRNIFKGAMFASVTTVQCGCGARTLSKSSHGCNAGDLCLSERTRNEVRAAVDRARLWYDATLSLPEESNAEITPITYIPRPPDGPRKSAGDLNANANASFRHKHRKYHQSESNVDTRAFVEKSQNAEKSVFATPTKQSGAQLDMTITTPRTQWSNLTDDDMQ